MVDGEVSSCKPVLSGVRQGSLLGPILLLIYINDLKEGVTSNILKLADDTKCLKELDRPTRATHLCRTMIKRDGKFFIVDFYKHNKRMGYVIIPKPHVSSREGIYYQCGRFDWSRTSV